MSRLTETSAALAGLTILVALTTQAQAPQTQAQAADIENFDEMLVLGAEPGGDGNAAAFVRAGDGAWQSCGLAGEAAQLAHRTLIRGVIHRHTTRGPDHQDVHMCSIATTREVVAPSAHALFPIDSQHFGPVDTRTALNPESLAPFAPQHLEVHQGESGRVQWTALWASELPNSIVIEGRRTMQGRAVAQLLEASTRTTRPPEIGREELFAPEIPDRARRLAIAHTRTFTEGHLEAASLCRGHERDLRIVHFALARDSTIRSWWRGVIRSTVLNHGARPWDAAHPGCDD